jgi:[ribosomal protein S5]-alanine N-acetyltransferase
MFKARGFLAMTICETENLIIREFSAADAEDLFHIYSNPEAMRFLGDPPASFEEERRNIENHVEQYYKELGFGLWGAILKGEDRLVGRCGILFQEIEGERRPELSYLIDNAYRGRGLATEAAKAVLEIARTKHGFDEMIAVIAVGNMASVRVAEKCCFAFERGLENFKDFGPVSVYSRILP